jgi:hypothetical protein
MATLPPEKRPQSGLRRLGFQLVAGLRRLLGNLFGFLMRDQIGDLSSETQRLSSASVESANYVGRELRAMDERLTRIEQELAAVRELIERDREPQAS